MASSAPAINVKENDKEYVVELAAPGMSKEEFRVHINEQNQLVVSMEKKNEQKEEDKSSKYLRREFHYSRFEQSMVLPDNVDKEAIQAKACHGILRIRLPKLEHVADKEPARRIEIQ